MELCSRMELTHSKKPTIVCQQYKDSVVCYQLPAQLLIPVSLTSSLTILVHVFYYISLKSFHLDDFHKI